MRVVRMLHRAALAAFVLLLAALTLCALALTAQNGVGDNRMLQVVTLARQPFLKSLSLSLCMLAALAGIHVLLEKIGGVRLNAGLCALWLAAGGVWIWAIGMRQLSRSDPKRTRQLRLLNTSAKTLRLAYRTDSGHLALSGPGEIAPGKEAVLEFTLDPRNMPDGQFVLKCTVSTQDEEIPVEVKGKIVGR